LKSEMRRIYSFF